jgi:ribonuclease R
VLVVLGSQTDPDVHVLSVLWQNEIPIDFSEAALAQAAKLPEVPNPEDFGGRRDLRNLLMVTIDGEDARDLDDAVSLERLADGTLRLGVHIADVTHYVREGTPLDQDAFERGTSVYLPDRVIPMLPEALSNGLCSLTARVPRLAFTVTMDVNPAGEVVGHDLFESVLLIDERMTYTAVRALLEDNGGTRGDNDGTREDNDGTREDNGGELQARYANVLPMLRDLAELAARRRALRKKRGSIDFAFDEAKIVTDGDGHPVDIVRVVPNVATNLIEECMLLCNETCPSISRSWASRLSTGCMRTRIRRRCRRFGRCWRSSATGCRIPRWCTRRICRAFWSKSRQARGEDRGHDDAAVPAKGAVQPGAHLAFWTGGAVLLAFHLAHPAVSGFADSPHHEGHPARCHGRQAARALPGAAAEAAKHCSERERAADEAERTCTDRMKAEYMQAHLGETFDGIVSGVTGFGLFVELANTVEGLVKLAALDDDYYAFNERDMTLVGEHTRKTWRIGDSMKVLVAGASPDAGQIDFVPADGRLARLFADSGSDPKSLTRLGSDLKTFSRGGRMDDRNAQNGSRGGRGSGSGNAHHRGGAGKSAGKGFKPPKGKSGKSSGKNAGKKSGKRAGKKSGEKSVR